MVRLASSTPYSWPWDGQLEPSRLALVVVSPLPTIPLVSTFSHVPAAESTAALLPADREAAALPAPSGAGNTLTAGEAVGSNAQLESATSRATQDLPTTAQQIAHLAELVAGIGGIVVKVACQSGDQPTPESWIAAPQIDGFYDSRLESHLRANGRDQLLIVGAWLETTVHSTLRSANDRGYECLILSDLCASYQQDLRTGSLSCIEMSGGIFGAIDTSTAVTALLTTHFAR